MAAALASQFTGSIVGLAVGDALGYPAEFRSRAELLRAFPPRGIEDFVPTGSHPRGTFSDDTQMTVALARGLLAARKRPEEFDQVMQAIAAEFVRWSQSPENDRAPGNTCMAACRNLAHGFAWREAGVKNSKGCGSAMRVAPIGLLYRDLDLVAHVARLSSVITHGHDAAIEGAAAAAIAVRMALDQATPEKIYEEIMRRCADRSADFKACFEKIPGLIDRPVEEVLSKRGLGEGWVAEEAVAGAMWCFFRSPDDYRSAILLAVNTDGDSDSLAAIAGSILGARLGLEAIPAEWARDIEKQETLIALGNALFEQRVD